ncbi:vWA domain-containing protein [Nocardioides sp.]|uniref:vWA domain-containing protein n=1 Tax=Nocardioides sp. TaxID=35761 RepID=UPI003D1282B7
MMQHAVDEVLLGFAAAVRAAGVPVTADRTHQFLQAAALVGVGDQRATWLAGRATLCGSPDDLERYDQVFEAWFLAREGLPRTVAPQDSPSPVAQLPTESDSDGVPEDDVLRVAASDAEVLRDRDVADLSAADRARLSRMFAGLSCRPPQRRALRRTPWHRGEVDASRTMRRMVSRLGESDRVAWRRRGTRPRRVILLIDVSGSMSAYADALLRLAHRFVVTSGTGGGATEVFTIGTRLTHVTRAMRLRDPERAIVAAGKTVPDWSGGTRLGETLKVFLDRWGQRGLARGAVVVIFSDGWERGDAALLATQAERLHRLAHEVVWVNPHRGKSGYEPVQQGIVAVLPHVDHFVAGHSMATYAELVEVVARA